MNQRKLIKLGNSSFAIALPKEWVNKSGLKKGDNIFISPNSNGELIIQPSLKNNNSNKKILINLTGKKNGEMAREIRAAYIRGYDIIEIEGIKDTNLKKEIKKTLKEFLSFELVQGKEDGVVIRDFFNIEEANLSNFIRRMDNNIREIFEIILDEFKKESLNLRKLREIDEIDTDVNKFYFLCSRVFLKGIDNPSILTALKTSGMNLFNEWWFAFNLEAMSDGLKYFSRACSKLDIEKNKEKINKIFLDFHQAYLKCMEAFYSGDIGLASKIIESTKKLEQGLEQLGKESKEIEKITDELEKVRKHIYQNAKMTLYLKY